MDRLAIEMIRRARFEWDRVDRVITLLMEVDFDQDFDDDEYEDEYD